MVSETSPAADQYRKFFPMEDIYDKKTDATSLMVDKSCFSCVGKTNERELNKVNGKLFVNYLCLVCKLDENL
ncbi:hypothetical protein GCM10028804_39870 [Larkinella terrae]